MLKTALLFALISPNFAQEVVQQPAQDTFIKVELEAKFVYERRGIEGAVQRECWMITKNESLIAKVDSNWCREYIKNTLHHDFVYNKKKARSNLGLGGLFGKEECFEEDVSRDGKKVGDRWSVKVDDKLCESNGQEDSQEQQPDIKVNW